MCSLWRHTELSKLPPNPGDYFVHRSQRYVVITDNASSFFIACLILKLEKKATDRESKNSLMLLFFRITG